MATELHSGFSSTDSLLVKGLTVRDSGPPQGISLRHVGLGNYELREGSSGDLEIASNLGKLVLSSGTTDAGTRGNIVFRAGVDTLTSKMTLTSAGTLDLRGTRVLSWNTTATSLSSANIGVDEIRLFIGGASGATLAIRSGGTVYYFSSSASTVG